MAKLRVGVIGIGQYAATRYVPDLRETGDAEIIAISRRNPERLALAKKQLEVPKAYTDWRELLDREDLDAVVVATSAGSHAEPTVAALEKGLHVLVAKPMALSMKDASSMVAAAESAGRLLLVGYNCRCQGEWRGARKIIDRGAVGQVRQIGASWCIDARSFRRRDPELVKSMREAARSGNLKDVFFADNFEAGHWRRDPGEAGGGFFVEVGTHLVDLILWLAGSFPSQVSAFSESGDLADNAYVSVQSRLRSNCLCSIAFGEGVGAQGARSFGEGHLSIVGDEGLLHADWAGWNPAGANVTLVKGGEGQEPEAVIEDITPAAAFVDAIRGGAPVLPSGAEAVGAVALTEAAYRSIAEGRIVEI